MAAVVKFQEDWPSTMLTLNLPLTVEHTMRILLKHGGRLVEPDGDARLVGVRQVPDRGDPVRSDDAQEHRWL